MTTSSGSLLRTFTSPKETLRKLWTDHAVYTKFVVLDLIEKLPNTDADTQRLLQNQEEIGKYIGTIIGDSNGLLLANLLKEHVNFGVTCILSLTQNSKVFAVCKQNLLHNSDEIGKFLHQIRPERRTEKELCDMFLEHNQCFLDMTVSQYQHDSSMVVKVFDAYYVHMLLVSDTIYDLLSA
jgi:hypothetical protein